MTIRFPSQSRRHESSESNALPATQGVPSPNTESSSNASKLERLPIGVGERQPPRRTPDGESTPRPRQGLSVLGYSLVGHRPGKPADKTGAHQTSGCLARAQDYLPFKLKASTKADAQQRVASLQQHAIREGHSEGEEWHDALERQDWLDASHREDAVAQAAYDAVTHPMSKVTLALHRADGSDAQIAMRYQKEGKERWLHIETKGLDAPGAQTLGPYRSKSALSGALARAVSPLLKGLSAEAPVLTSLRPDVHIVGPPSTSGLTEKQINLIGVARWPDAKYNIEASVVNGWYARRYYRNTLEAATRIANGEIASFRALWAFVGKVRHEWAEIRNDAKKDDFRPELRTLTLRTPLTGRYEYLAQRLEQEYQSGQRQMEFEAGYLGAPFDWAAHHVFQAKETLNGQEIRLTNLKIAIDPSHFGQFELQIAMKGVVLALPALIEHTPATNIVPIMNHVESLFEDLVRNPHSPAGVMDVLADAHWWLAHATPDMRGSAAKSEMAVRAMAAAQGMELPPFKSGIVPDMEAFPVDRATFRARYVDMFDGPVGLPPYS